MARAQNDAAHYKQCFEESLTYLDTVAAEYEQQKTLAMAAIAGSSVVAAALGTAAGVFLSRRANAATLARVSQEMVDIQRRSSASLAKAERYGAEKLAKSLVPALDAMDALEKAARDGTDAEGARLTRAALHDALRSNGVEAVAPEVGDKFDVANMEAMMTVEVLEAERVNTVQALLRPGYVLHGERVLRAAQVGVGTAAAAAKESGGGEDGAPG